MVDTGKFTMNFCNDCELESSGFSRASLEALKDLKRRQKRHELMQQAIKEAYDNSESKQERERLEAERIYLEAHPPMLNEKYEDIRRKIPKYSEID
jgi:hypothetical protein